MKNNINGLGGILVILGLYFNWESSLGRDDLFKNILLNFINGLIATPIGDISFAWTHGFLNLHISTLCILLGYFFLLMSTLIPGQSKESS